MSSILFPFLVLKSLGQLIVFRGVFRMKQKPKEKYRTTLPRTVWPICLERIWGDDPLQVTPILQRLKGLWGEFPIWFNAMNPELCSLLLPEELTNFIRSLPFRQSNFFFTRNNLHSFKRSIQCVKEQISSLFFFIRRVYDNAISWQQRRKLDVPIFFPLCYPGLFRLDGSDGFNDRFACRWPQNWPTQIR